MRIELATDKDLDEIVRLASQVHAIHVALFPHIFKPAVAEEMRSFFGDMLADESARIFVARDESTPLGYLLLRIHDQEERRKHLPPCPPADLHRPHLRR